MVVTGASSGVGECIARTMARAGALVTICGRRAEPLARVATTSERIVAVVADVTNEDDVSRLFDEARAAHGPVGVVVASAGGSESAPMQRTTLCAWEATLAVNLTGVFLTFRAGLADMRREGWGRLLCIASTAGLKGYAYVTPYCAAKHGAIGLTRSLALELANTPVTVNAICPGFTETPMLLESIQRIMEKTGRSEEQARSSLRATNPQGRFIQPEEIVEAAMWLCSEGARSVTGQAVAIAGGEV